MGDVLTIRRLSGVAACRDLPPVLFFGPDFGETWPERVEREAEAKAICAGCDVRVECRAGADARNEQAGIWGGENEDERRSRRRREQRQRLRAGAA